MDYTFDDFIDEFSNAERVCALTGAGISAEGGLPTFRGKGGIWEEVSIDEVATLTAFRNNPRRVWEWFIDLRKVIDRCRPNPSHYALAELEKRFQEFTVITQNIDNYHQLAGSKNIVELHGNAWWDRCWVCGKRYEVKEIEPHETPPRCGCGGKLKPDVVFFEEQLPLDAVDKAFNAARNCEFLLVIGTSAIVVPAASIPYFAYQSGAKIIEFNLEPTGHTSLAHLSFFEPASGPLKKIANALEHR